MATKAQRFRVQQQRAANPPKPKKAVRPPADRSRKAKPKEGAALERTESGRPSRKSTRKSAGRAKRTTNLRRRAIRETRSAKERARKSKVRGR